MENYQYGIKFQDASWMTDPHRWERVGFGVADRSVAEQLPVGATLVLFIQAPVRRFMGVVRVTHSLADSTRLHLAPEPQKPLLLAVERVFPEDDEEPDAMTGLSLPEAGIDLGKMGSRAFEPLSVAGIERLTALIRVRYAQM